MKKQLILYASVFTVMLIVGYFVIAAEEKRECLQWARESNEYLGYFVTRNQVSQCEVYEVYLPTHKLERM